MRNLITLLLGTLFGIGLGHSGMAQPHKVQNFLHLTGAWDPSLAFVMIGAIGVAGLGHLFLNKKQKSPIFEESFSLPKGRSIDRPLMLGAFLFGIGWALTGICPGPALANLVRFDMKLLAFIVSMLVGLFFASLLSDLGRKK